jgi:hypothetical protein
MHERPGNQLTGKKFNPWVLAISAHDRLAQAIPVATPTMLSCRHFGHSTAISTTCVAPSCIKCSRDPACDGNTHSSLTFFGELSLSGDQCVLTRVEGRQLGTPDASISCLFEGSRHFLLIFASLREDFVFFHRQQLVFPHHHAPSDNHRFHIVSLQRIG